MAVAVASGEKGQAALTETQAKASFLYNCAMFIAWPPGAQVGNEIMIGIIGDDATSGVVKLLQGQTVDGKTLRVKSLRAQDSVAGYHILFVADDGSRSAKTLLSKMGDAPILTVGEYSDFTSNGGIVRLYTEEGRLRFEINVTRAEAAGLRVSAKMLGLAKIVR